ncbi:Rieske (2Fe-2S) protein [Parapedobacter sp. 10938]|uniref:Rieske (2Fe-2S) protein n=1 Tax=Parapedobacter flavus TaxID=3110225 RepID=UPI002DB6C9A9|nr:Rieske 2Fe-2S domain-containing protein [Parapedobacter sp. 10938]MEC3881247.1 Rieske 2Fe-2S domain-containing protein [Parapedobacter sp. 10938]
MKWIKVAKEAIPKTDGIRKVKIAGKGVCIIRDGGALHATSARCPHAGADLSGGWCEKERLICPYHRHAFSLETGRGDPGQGDYITIYPLEEREGEWFIGMKESWLGKLFNK